MLTILPLSSQTGNLHLIKQKTGSHGPESSCYSFSFIIVTRIHTYVVPTVTVTYGSKGPLASGPLGGIFCLLDEVTVLRATVYYQQPQSYKL